MFFLIAFLKPYKFLIASAILLLIINKFSDLYLPTLTADIINVGIATGNLTYIYDTAYLMTATALIGGLSFIATTILSAKVSSSVAGDLRSALFTKVQELSLSDLQTIGIPSLITRCNNDVNILQRSGMMFLQLLLPAPVMIAVGLALAFNANVKMGYILILFIISLLTLALLVGKRTISLFREIQIRMDYLNGVLREIISGVRVIRAFNQENFEQKRFNQSATDYCDAAIRTSKIFAFLLPIMVFLLNLGIIFIILIGGYEILLSSMQLGNILAIIEYFTLILFAVMMASFVFMELPRAQSCAERVGEVLQMVPSVLDAPRPLSLQNITGVIEFKNVTFTYPGAQKPVLSDLSFTLKPGELTAIIGGTGSGKSTIINLLLRFFEPTAGHIYLDGININKLTQHDLRRHLGYVPQKAILFRGTIASNIQKGNPNATESQLLTAAQIARVHDFASLKKDGYQSFVAQGGSNLSGGQKQRIGIARALLRQPKIYLFDDSFSALDYKTDTLIRNSLTPILANATCLIVAQRVNTIKNAAKILVLEKGQLIAQGQHQELLRTCPIYQQIVASQKQNIVLNEGDTIHD